MQQESTSYWHRTSPQIALTTNLPATAEVVVVGGGWLGAATSYYLARKGVDVVLLESRGLAYGATGRNGGFMMSGPAESYPDAIARLGHETAREIMALTLANRELVREIIAEEEIACDYREPGGLSLALNQQQFAKMATSVEALHKDDFAGTLLDREQVQGMISTPPGEEIVGGMYMPGQGLVHSARLIQGVVGAAQRHGARIAMAMVQRFEPDGQAVIVHTTQGKLRAGAVVVAVNAWTGTLFPQLAQLIVPVRGQALAYAPIAPVFKTSMSVSVTSTGEYWQQTLDGAIVLGGCRAVVPGRDVGVLEMTPTEEVQAALELIFPKLFPSLGELRVTQRWAGLMAFTPDYVPVADRLQNMPVWVVGGFCGHGMPFGMRLGQLLADGATSSKKPSALHPFRFERETLRL